MKNISFSKILSIAVQKVKQVKNPGVRIYALVVLFAITICFLAFKTVLMAITIIFFIYPASHLINEYGTIIGTGSIIFALSAAFLIIYITNRKRQNNISKMQ